MAPRRRRPGREPADPERIEPWRTEMSPEDRAGYEELAGDLLADLG